MAGHEHRERNAERMVPVAVAPNEMIAGMWQGWLENAGIRSMAKPTGPGMAYFTTFGLEHILYVLESDEAQAKEILAAEDEGGQGRADPPPDSPK